MASYPNSVPSFTTKTDGPTSTIFAEHVNAPQAEIVAIAGGLINGLAHNSTPDANNTRSLGVTGRKWLDAFITTLKSALGTASLPTYSFDGDLNTGIYSSGADAVDFATAGAKALGIDSTGFVDSPTQPRCVAFNSATQTVVAGNTDVLTLDSEVIDVGAMHDTVTNNNRITIPTGGDGLYWCAGLSLAAYGTGVYHLHLRKGGSTQVQTTIDNSGGSALTTQTMHVFGLLSLAAAEYVELAGQAVTANCTFGSATAARATRLAVVKLW
jgi:hypothetical protein